VVEALLDAIGEGKQVAALVELKARFDEESNVEWARALERDGVHVVYGLPGLKVHCKTALVVRREGDAIGRYVHLATGNYNSVNAVDLRQNFERLIRREIEHQRNGERQRKSVG
jgi:polyphosphate kinase